MVGSASLFPPARTKGVIRVEGPDDKGVLVAMLQYLGVGRGIDVKDSCGIQGLLAAVPVELKGSQIGQLGIVTDADADIGARWDAIKGVLVKSGYSAVPAKPKHGGTIISAGDLPRVGIWIMPDNASVGAVEGFVSTLVPTSDTLWPLATTTVSHVITVEQRFIPSHQSKATMHTWLAWQAEPGRPMGQAITKRDLDPSLPNATALCAWLRTLFSLP
jgi:hypothetical protein